MNLVSCEYCGVVLNIKYIKFPDIDDMDTVDVKFNEKYEWYNGGFVPIAQCPVCKEYCIRKFETL